jgi:hypothetical protein
MYDFSSENVGSLGKKDFLNIMIGVENSVMIVLNIMKGIKTGSKNYVFNIGVENRVKIFREKTQENLGMKTWIRQTISKANYGVLNSSKKRTKFTILSKKDAQYN